MELTSILLESSPNFWHYLEKYLHKVVTWFMESNSIFSCNFMEQPNAPLENLRAKIYGFLKFPFYSMVSFKSMRNLPSDSLKIIWLKTKFWVDIQILLSNRFPITTFFLNFKHNREL